MILYLFRSVSKKILTFGETFTAWLSKLHSTCQKGCFEGIFSHNISNLFIIRNYEQRIFGFQQSFVGRVVKTAFYMSKGTFWGEFFEIWSNLFINFKLGAKKLEFVQENLGTDVITAFYTFIDTVSAKKRFFKKSSLSYHFRTLRKTLLEFRRKFWGKVPELQFTFQKEHFEEKNHKNVSSSSFSN